MYFSSFCFSFVKLLGKVEDQARDEKLLWELLERKRKNQAPESPMGPKELQFTEPSKKRKVMPLISHKPITRSLSRGQSPHTPHPDHWIPLGTSPSVAQQVSRRYITHWDQPYRCKFAGDFVIDEYPCPCANRPLFFIYLSMLNCLLQWMHGWYSAIDAWLENSVTTWYICRCIESIYFYILWFSLNSDRIIVVYPFTNLSSKLMSTVKEHLLGININKEIYPKTIKNVISHTLQLELL